MMNMTVGSIISILHKGATKKIDPKDKALYQETLRNYEAIGPTKFSFIDRNNAATLKAKLARFNEEVS